MKQGNLSFSRKPGEGFTIFTDQGEIRVCIVESSYTRVRVSVNAPDEMLILRDELINKEKKDE